MLYSTANVGSWENVWRAVCIKNGGHSRVSKNEHRRCRRETSVYVRYTLSVQEGSDDRGGEGWGGGGRDGEGLIKTDSWGLCCALLLSLQTCACVCGGDTTFAP